MHLAFPNHPWISSRLSEILIWRSCPRHVVRLKASPAGGSGGLALFSAAWRKIKTVSTVGFKTAKSSAVRLWHTSNQHKDRPGLVNSDALHQLLEMHHPLLYFSCSIRRSEALCLSLGGVGQSRRSLYFPWGRGGEVHGGISWEPLTLWVAGRRGARVMCSREGGCVSHPGSTGEPGRMCWWSRKDVSEKNWSDLRVLVVARCFWLMWFKEMLQVYICNY